MTDFRQRLRSLSGELSERLLEGLAEVEFRARLSVALTEALTELAAQRRRAAATRAAASTFAPFGAEAQLTAASDQLADRREEAAATGRSAGARSWSLHPRPGRLRYAVPVGIALVSVTGAATASSLWLAPAGNPTYGFNPGLVSGAPPGAQLGALAVLRRPQTNGDRGPGVQAALTDVNNFTRGLRSDYVRVLETTRDGPVVLVPVQRRGASAIGARARPAIRDALCVYYPFTDRGSLNTNTHCWSTEQLLAGQALAGIGAHEYGLVPDGVLSVRIAVGARRRSVQVHRNFFDVTLPVGSRTAGLSTGVPISPTIAFSPAEAERLKSGPLGQPQREHARWLPAAPANSALAGRASGISTPVRVWTHDRSTSACARPTVTAAPVVQAISEISEPSAHLPLAQHQGIAFLDGSHRRSAPWDPVGQPERGRLRRELLPGLAAEWRQTRGTKPLAYG